MVAGIGSHEVANGNGKRDIDMRSDTVTQPSEPMRKAMAEAKVGDDVFGDDPTVIELEEHVANLLGKEAGLFIPSGTMGNLIAVGVHCSGRGEEVICGKCSHTFVYEQGGASSLMGVIFNTVPNQPDGSLALEDIRGCIKPAENPHFAASKLVIIENTQNKMGGCVLTPAYMAKVGDLCRELHLKFHVDGARLWNAAVKLGVPMKEFTKDADTVTVCLSKGLGAPVGSVLCGTSEFIFKARRMRKALGGGMRQAGVLAAAGLYAIKHNVERLSEDHANALRLANGLEALGLKVVKPDTNLLFFEVQDANAFATTLGDHGIRVLCLDGVRTIRAVCNLHVSTEDIDHLLQVATTILKDWPAAKKPRLS